MDGENVQQGGCVIPSLTAFQVQTLKKLARSNVKALVACGGVETDTDKDELNGRLAEVKQLVALKLVVTEDEDREKVIALTRKQVGDEREVYPIILTLKGQMLFERFRHSKYVN